MVRNHRHRVARSLLAAAILSVPIAAFAQSSAAARAAEARAERAPGHRAVQLGCGGGTSGASRARRARQAIGRRLAAPQQWRNVVRHSKILERGRARGAAEPSGGTELAGRPAGYGRSPAAVPGVPARLRMSPNDPAPRRSRGARAKPRPTSARPASPNVDPNIATGGGRARLGATGKTMSECMAAWDAETHLSKDKWRETCQRTLTEPHL